MLNIVFIEHLPVHFNFQVVHVDKITTSFHQSDTSLFRHKCMRLFYFRHHFECSLSSYCPLQINYHAHPPHLLLLQSGNSGTRIPLHDRYWSENIMRSCLLFRWLFRLISLLSHMQEHMEYLWFSTHKKVHWGKMNVFYSLFYYLVSSSCCFFRDLHIFRIWWCQDLSFDHIIE